MPIARQSYSERIRNGAEIAVKMMIPPMVGVPALEWWPSGPSSRMFWPNSLTRRNEMNCGDRKTQMSSAAVPPIRISPISGPSDQRFRDGLEPDAARRLDEDGVARLHELLDERGGLSGGVDRVVAAHRRGARTDGDEHVGALARVGADLLVEAPLVGAELEHVPEHGDAPAGGTGELVEGGTHRHRVGVVAVVHDDSPVGELDPLAAARRQLDLDQAVRLDADRTRRGA